MSTRITQKMKYRHSILKHMERFGVKSTCLKFDKSRSYLYFWKKRYNGKIESLADYSRKPKAHPNEHTPAEIKLIKNMREKNKSLGLVEFWLKLTKRGYQRTIDGLYKVMRRLKLLLHFDVKPKYIPKPYQQMTYAGERVQIDVKVVPKQCILKHQETGEKYYQYTAIDEFSRIRYTQAFKSQDTYSSAQFLKNTISFFKKVYRFDIKCVQTDNGTEFTNRFVTGKTQMQTLFQLTAQKLSVTCKFIRPYTPRHNGKVERSHKEDQKRFYNSHTFFSFRDFQIQLAAHRRYSNNMPMRPLKWLSPKQFIKQSVQDD